MPGVYEETVVSFPRELVCEFFRRPGEVLAISDPAVGARIVAAPDVLSEGDQITIELMAMGMTRTATNEVVAANFPEGFTEAQVDGPLKAYRHDHRFRIDDDRTVVTDEIEFEPPGGIAGLLLSAEAIAEQLADSIAYRNRQLPAALAEFAKTAG